MKRLNRRIKHITNLIKREGSKIKLYFSYENTPEWYDKYEDKTEYSNLNPITIKGYVYQFSPTSLVWKQYGLTEQGAREILCDAIYKNYFEKCNKLEIDGDEYEVFKEGGGRLLITERSNKLIKVVVRRKS